MAGEEGSPKQIKFIFVKANDCKTSPVDGVWGGVTPHGQIRMELFTEIIPNPEYVLHAIAPEGKLGSEIERVPKASLETVSVLREIHTIAIMSPTTAEFIGRWLLERVQELKTSKG